MKKLMMAAALVLAAISLNAATTSWKWSTSTSVLKDGYLGNGSSSAIMANTMVYCLFAEGATGTSDTSAQTALLAGLRDGSIAIGDIATMAKASTKTDAAGKILAANAVTFDLDSVAVGSNAFFYEVVVSPDQDFVYMSSLSKATALEEGKAQTVTTTSAASTNLRDSEGTAAYSNPGWYAVAPEPTSGLMMLLGLGALALRRRRA